MNKHLTDDGFLFLLIFSNLNPGYSCHLLQMSTVLEYMGWDYNRTKAIADGLVGDELLTVDRGRELIPVSRDGVISNCPGKVTYKFGLTDRAHAFFKLVQRTTDRLALPKKEHHWVDPNSGDLLR